MTTPTPDDSRYAAARRIFNQVKRDGKRPLTLPEIQRVIDAHESHLAAEVTKLRGDRYALAAMVEACRDLVPGLRGHVRDDLAGIVGWPPAEGQADPLADALTDPEVTP